MSGEPRRVVLLDDPDWDDLGSPIVQFRLTYAGQLEPFNSRRSQVAHQHKIRRAFHPQLKRLWEEHPAFAPFWRPTEWVDEVDGGTPGGNETWPEFLARNFARNGYNFVPLVNRWMKVACRIDVLYLRPKPPGDIIKAGDIDNRLKTLFDALKMPSASADLGEHKTPNADEQPFYCLLEDDGFITSVSVEADMMLEPFETAQPGIRDARLVLTVTLRPYVGTGLNLTLG